MTRYILVPCPKCHYNHSYRVNVGCKRQQCGYVSPKDKPK